MSAFEIEDRPDYEDYHYTSDLELPAYLVTAITINRSAFPEAMNQIQADSRDILLTQEFMNPAARTAVSLALGCMDEVMAAASAILGSGEIPRRDVIILTGAAHLVLQQIASAKGEAQIELANKAVDNALDCLPPEIVISFMRAISANELLDLSLIRSLPKLTERYSRFLMVD